MHGDNMGEAEVQALLVGPDVGKVAKVRFEIRKVGSGIGNVGYRVDTLAGPTNSRPSRIIYVSCQGATPLTIC